MALPTPPVDPVAAEEMLRVRQAHRDLAVSGAAAGSFDEAGNEFLMVGSDGQCSPRHTIHINSKQDTRILDAFHDVVSTLHQSIRHQTHKQPSFIELIGIL
jgi:hypothetical protein